MNTWAVTQAWLWFTDHGKHPQMNIEYWLMKNPPAPGVEPLVHAKESMPKTEIFRGCSD